MSKTFELDARGLFCPEPVMLLHKKIREAAVGDILQLTASDPSTTRDVVKFCTFLEHKLLSQHQDEQYYYYSIEKC